MENPVKLARSLIEDIVPPVMRGPDWKTRWNELEACSDAPFEIQQIGLMGAPAKEELMQATQNGYLTAAEFMHAVKNGPQSPC